MTKWAIARPSFADAAKQSNMSPAAILSGKHLFLTGSTGGRADGQLPHGPVQKIRNSFGKIVVIAENGTD